MKPVERIARRRGLACVGCGRAVPTGDGRPLPEGWWADGDAGVACDDEGCQRILAAAAPRRKARRPRKPLSEGGPVRILSPQRAHRALGVAMDALIVKVERLTLSSLCDGRVEQQVNAALARVAESFEDEDLQQGRTKLKAKLKLEVELELNTDSGSVKVSAKCDSTLPGPRAVEGVALLRHGAFYVEPDLQEELPYSKKGGEA